MEAEDKEGKDKKKIKIQTLKEEEEEEEEEDDEAMKSDMSLRGCSMNKKRKNNQSEEGNNNKKRKQQPTNKKKKKNDEKVKKRKKGLFSGLRQKEDMVNLLPGFRLKRFLSPKKNKTCYSQPLPKSKNKINKGDIVNLSQLLFTEDRDFLITYKDRGRPVRAKHLEGKVIVLHFVSLVPWSGYCDRYNTTILMDIYHALQPKGGFEVVFVGVQGDTAASSTLDSLELNNSTLKECFEDKFSIMPWTAIPFSDIESRKYLERRFPLSGLLTGKNPISFVIDPTGMVSQCHADRLFFWHGARAYPFTDKRIEFLSYEDEEAGNRPSITKLLASPERSHLINNNNQAVPLHNLKDKVVGLYFYEDYSDELTIKIEKAYERYANFEIVLVYIHDALITFSRVSEKSYWKSFRRMPWLALPYKDPACKRLQRIFDYPMDAVGTGPDPSLVIIGPRGKFVEPYGADILKQFGNSAYPFTRKIAVRIEAEYIKGLNFDMFFNPSDTFIKKGGPTVLFWQLVGKRIILIIEDEYFCPGAKFWRMLRARYLQMKGTDDEFEVIHTCRGKRYSFGKNIATSSWLRHPGFCTGSSQWMQLIRFFMGPVGVVAFDHDGRVVRRTVSASIGRGNLEFPFYAGGLEKDVLGQLTDWFKWDY